MDRDAERMAVDRELADHDRAEFDGLSIRYCRLGAVNSNGVGPGWSCVATRQSSPSGGSNRSDAGRSSRPLRPHHRRRHVDVGVRRIDGEVGAVERVAEHLVTDRDAAVVAGDHPPIRIRTVDVELAAVAGRSPARRRRSSRSREASSARATSGSCAARAALAASSVKVDLDLHPSVLRFGKGEPVADDGLRARRVPRQTCEQQDGHAEPNPRHSYEL